MKKTTKTQKKVIKRSAAAMMTAAEKEETVNVNVPPKKLWLVLFFLVILVLAGLLFSKKYRGLIFAGTVNGKPVTRWQLEVALNERYGKQTFDDLASNILLKQLATQNQITVSDDEVKKETDTTEARLGGKEALNSTLERLGYTQTRFKQEMSNQVIVKKLADKLFKIDITDAEVAKFYQDNKTLFPGKKLEEVKADIKQNLAQQKLQQEFSTWFQDQRKKAAVVSYI